MRRCHQELNTCDCLLSLSDNYHNNNNEYSIHACLTFTSVSNPDEISRKII